MANNNGHHQNILRTRDIYDEAGEYVTTEKWLEIPKIINSDISFQLMFGMTFPYEKSNERVIMEEQNVNIKDYYNG
jgi:hypothetical protein|tara:strand:+ start:151 stop:378 length:228 start_codon:yes stop_codon:yes gene_type:complete